MAQALKPTTSKLFKVVLRPERVAVVRRGNAPEIIDSVAAVSIRGGERLPSDTKRRFSFGYKSPAVVGIMLKKGGRRRIENSTALLVDGGKELEANDKGQFAADSEIQKWLDPHVHADFLDQAVPHNNEKGILALPGGNARWLDELEEFQREMRILSYPQSDGRLLDEFEKYQIIHAKVQEEVQEAQPFIRGLPPSALGQIIGNRKLVTGDGQLVTILQWLGEVTETTALAFSVGIVPPSNTDPSIGAVYRPYAITQFGTLGAIEEMEIDVGFGGTQFTVCGNVATIRMAMDKPGAVQVGSQIAPGFTTVFQYPVADASYAPTTPGPSTPFPKLNMYGMVSFNTAQRATPLTRTRYIDDLPDNGFVTFAIPKFATQLFPPLFISHSSVTTAGSIQIVFQDFQGNNIGYLTVTGQTMIQAPAPIPGDAAFVKVINKTGGGTALDGRLVFALQL